MPDDSSITGADFKKFEELLKAVLLEVRGILKRNRESLPTDRYYFLTRPSPGTTIFDYREEIEWDDCVHGVLRQIEIPSYLALIEFVKSTDALKGAFLVDGAGNPLRNSDPSKWFQNGFLWLFLSYYFQKANSFRFKPSIFRMCMNITKERIKKTKPKGVVICPLTNVQLQIKEIRLGKDILIRKVTEIEKEHWMNNDRVSIPRSDLNDIDCVIEIQFEKPSTHTGTIPFEEKKKIIAALTPIQLVMGTKVRTVFLEEKITNEFDLRSWVIEWVSGTHYVGDIKIDAKRKKQIISTFAQIESKKDVLPLQLAIRRWDYSRDRGNEEDPILDYWIGLEALFNSKGAGIRHSASMRAACFLGKNAKQRLYMFKMFQQSYDLRCDVAHGRKFNARENATILRETGTCLQTAIYNLLRRTDISTTDNLYKAIAKIDTDLIERGMKGKRVGYLL